MHLLQHYLFIAPEIQKALVAGQPVVALEANVLTLGLPYPQNVQAIQNTQQIVRQNGALPAIIAIVNGKLRVGLTQQELDYLGQKSPTPIKASRRDIPLLLTRGQDGITTVAATMILGALAGIKVFSTSSVGGVHRDAATTMDISPDLEELAKTSTIVVSSGARSVIDLSLTLEFLETRSVPVVGYGTDEMPSFYSRESGFKTNYRSDSPEEIAQLFALQEALGLRGSMLVANPIPKEHAMEPDLVNMAVSNALDEANSLGIRGADVTPFLLKKIQEITNGKSLDAHVQLLYNNAALAAKIARSYSRQTL